MSVPSGVDPGIRKQAIAWYVRLCSGEASEAEHSGCRQWLQQDARHRDAWTQVSGVGAIMRQVPGNIAGPTLRSAEHGRRAALKRLTGIASFGALAALGYQTLPWREWSADHRTGVGQRRRLVLADGSELWLNTGTAVDVHFDGEQRLLRLHAGELRLQTGHAPGEWRPLRVETAHGRVQALGTRFLVRLGEAATRVSVLEHAVQVQPRRADGDAVAVQAGYRVDFDAGGIRDTGVAIADADAWTAGQLIVDNRPLGEVVAELARHRHGILRCDPAVAAIRVSGVYPLDDTDRALEVLARRFPVRVSGRYWTTLVPA